MGALAAWRAGVALGARPAAVCSRLAEPQAEAPTATGGDAGAGQQAQAREQEDDEAELDPADARQALTLGSSSSSGGVSAGGPGSHAARLALTCHVAYHLSYRVPVLYFEAAGLDGAPPGLDALLESLPRLRAA
ncbi:hypothetical protein ABPG77_002973 [Micractinium sp. CCAP 211/92]